MAPRLCRTRFCTGRQTAGACENLVVVNAKSIFQDGWQSERMNQCDFVAAAE